MDNAAWYDKLASVLQEKHDTKSMLESGLSLSREIANCDAGTVYSKKIIYSDNIFTPKIVINEVLEFDVIQNETMDIFKRRDKDNLEIPPVPLRIEGEFNLKNVSAYCCNNSKIINIADVYDETKFDFSGTKKYDENFGYNSKSMLVFPLLDRDQQVIGVFQLINKKDREGNLIAFSEEDEAILVSMSLIMGMILSIQGLYDQQKQLFQSMVSVLAKNIEEKSPHTYDHITRVSILSGLISRALTENREGIYKEVAFNDFDMEEIRTSALLHDIGKITTPENLLGKEVKLQIMTDRMELISERHNSHYKDKIIESLQKKLSLLETPDDKKDEFDKIDENLEDVRIDCLKKLSMMCEYNFSHENANVEVEKIIDQHFDMYHTHYFSPIMDAGGKMTNKINDHAPEKIKLITEEEKENLLIPRGTLTFHEREIIKEHALKSWGLLLALRFPADWKAIPMIASSHHETLDGTGYPYSLTWKEMPIKARIIAIADLLEALSSKSRPYRGAFKINQFMDILGEKVKTGKIDGEILYVFLCSKYFTEFVDNYLSLGQKSEFDYNNWYEKYYEAPKLYPTQNTN